MATALRPRRLLSAIRQVRLDRHNFHPPECTLAGMAVACMDEGLLPMSQQATEIYDLVCYHEYGFADEDNPEECLRLGEDMADK
jgi:hypothetical protein